MTAEPLSADTLYEIWRRNRSNLDAGFTVESHTHGEKGCRCLGHYVTTGVTVTLAGGFYCDDQPESANTYDGGCAEPLLPSVDASNLVKGVNDVRDLLAEIDRLNHLARRPESLTNLMRKLLNLVHI